MVGDDQLGIEILFLAKPVAGRAGALGGVEAEQPGFDLGDGEAGDGTGELFGEGQAVGFGRFQAAGRVFALDRPAALGGGGGGGQHGLGIGGGGVGEFGDRQPFGQLQRGFETFGEAALDTRLHHDPVDDDVDVMLVFLVEHRRFVDLVECRVDLDAGEAVLLQLQQLLAILALAPAHDRREQEQPCPLWQRHDAVDHLADRLRGDRQAGGRRIGHTDARPQQAHVIVDFGDGGDGRTRVFAGGLLFDADRGAEALDMVDIGLRHQFEELARVSRQGFDVAALPLGIDGVEGERGFAASRQAGDDRQTVLGQVDVDALEVVLARAANLDMGQHLGRLFQICS